MRTLFRAGAHGYPQVAKLLHLLLAALLYAALTPVTTHAQPLGATHATVWESEDEFVKLVPQDALPGARATPNQHPIILKPDDLATALAKVTFLSGERRVSVMDSKVSSRLASHLAEALARASPGQDVIFAVLFWVRADIVGSKDVTVAARAFYSGARLHLIVGDLHRSAVAPEFNRSPVGNRKIDRRLHPHEPGARSHETSHDGMHLEAAPGIQLFEANGRARQDWLVLDIAASTKRAVQDQEGKEREPVKEITPTAEERLMRLKRLYEQGLITADEYARKRKEIIDQL
jgi:Short C-terminal domain